jgi:hypothetical protein
MAVTSFCLLAGQPCRGCGCAAGFEPPIFFLKHQKENAPFTV